MALKCLSWNINGLNNPQKRRKVFCWINKQKADVTCLQEVHIKEVNKNFLLNKKLGIRFDSLAKVKKRGVVMYVKEELSPKKIFQDEDGRLLAVEINVDNKKTLLVGVYAPNGAKEKFFCKLKEMLEGKTYDQTLLLGDFNGVVDPVIDKTPRNKGGRLPKIFFEMVNQEGLEDLWRLFNSKGRDYTYFSACKKSWTRIDMIWGSKVLTPLIKEVDIFPKVFSDHNPLICVIKKQRKTFKWRLNENILQQTKKYSFYRNK